jgi:poly-gamma-glutamate system protein
MARFKLNSNVVLGLFALAALAAFFAVENSKRMVRQDWYEQKLDAAKQAKVAAAFLKEFRLKHGVFVDAVNDPNETALIGQSITPVTTDRGFLDVKIASTNPNFAAVVVEMLEKAEVKEKDCIAVAMTGSFPALNIAVLSAIEKLKLTPISITSVGSSNFGANDPQFTWLDMERVLNEIGIFHFRSVAASIGGGGDIGRGLSPQGRAMILDAIKRNNTALIHEQHLEQSIEKRLKVYDEHCKGNPIKAYINIGGGIASLGAMVNGDIIPNGLSTDLPVKNYPVRGVIIEMAKRGIPIIHLYDINKIWKDHGLPMNPIPLPEPGDGGIFVRERYNRTLAWGAVTVLSAMILLAGYFDRRKHRLGGEPVVTTSGTSDHEL